MTYFGTHGPVPKPVKAEKQRKPMKRVSAKRAAYRASDAGQEDAKYLQAVRALPCCICHEFGLRQLSPTQAHHCIHGRHGTRKVPDKMAIPLCESHHQGLLDTSKTAIHRAPAEWKAKYGADTDWISWTEERVAL